MDWKTKQLRSYKELRNVLKFQLHVNQAAFMNYVSRYVRQLSDHAALKHLSASPSHSPQPPLLWQMEEAEAISNNELPRRLSVLTPFRQSPLNTLTKNREDRNLSLHLKRLDGGGVGWTNNKINSAEGRSYRNGGIKFGRKCWRFDVLSCLT